MLDLLQEEHVVGYIRNVLKGALNLFDPNFSDVLSGLKSDSVKSRQSIHSFFSYLCKNKL